MWAHQLLACTEPENQQDLRYGRTFVALSLCLNLHKCGEAVTETQAVLWKATRTGPRRDESLREGGDIDNDIRDFTFIARNPHPH